MYFHPAEGWHRKYQSYNSEANYIIEITMGIQPEHSTIQNKKICYEDKCAGLIIYPDDINKFFLEQEALMEE
jgi:hypothetical protein